MVSTIQHGVTAPCPYWTAVDTTAQLGCGIGRVCPVNPPAGIVGVLLSRCRADTVSEIVRDEAAAGGLRGYPPCIPANLKAGRVWQSWAVWYPDFSADDWQDRWPL